MISDTHMHVHIHIDIDIHIHIHIGINLDIDIHVRSHIHTYVHTIRRLHDDLGYSICGNGCILREFHKGRYPSPSETPFFLLLTFWLTDGHPDETD